VTVPLLSQIKPQPQIRVRPQILQFNNQGGQKVVAIDNIGNADMSVLAVQIGGNENIFSVQGYQPNNQAPPWTLPPGGSGFQNVIVSYNGQPGNDTQMCIIWVVDAVNVETCVDLVVGGTGVCAEPDAGADQTARPLATVHLDGTNSNDPNDSADPGEAWYLWDWQDYPEGVNLDDIALKDAGGRNITGIWTNDANPNFFAELAGVYTVRLRVNQSDDPGCIVYDTVNIYVVPDETIHIQLRWDGYPGNDHDLHLIKPCGFFTRGDSGNATDCHWLNCNTSGSGGGSCPPRGCPGPLGAPDWGQIGVREDDPTLDIDDIPGTGPENINLSLPEVGDFLVAVENYSGGTNVECIIKIWLFGVQNLRVRGKITDGSNYHWNVATIHVISAADIYLEPINTFEPSN
jgi:hypothetical protein